jgi:hypothetical protein
MHERFGGVTFMTDQRYGAVIIERVVGIELPAAIVRFLRSIEEKKFRLIYDGEKPTSYGRYTGRHMLFEVVDGPAPDKYPEYDVILNELGEVQVRRRDRSIEDELFSIEYIERTESPNY